MHFGQTMAESPTFIALFAGVLLLVSGCFGSEGTKAAVGLGVDGDAATADEAAFDATSGALKGFILTPDAVGVPGADILLLPGERNTTSAADGSYALSYIDPGTYQVTVTRLGYDVAVRGVTIYAGERAEVDITLAAIPVFVPRKEVLQPYEGYMQCRFATIITSGPCGWIPFAGVTLVSNALFPNDKNRYNFEITGDDWTHIVFEAEWTATSAATNPRLQLIFSCFDRPGSCNDYMATGAAENYIKAVFKRPVEPREVPKYQPGPGALLTAFMIIPFGTATNPVNFALEQTYTSVITIFYSKDVPEGYTAFEQ